MYKKLDPKYILSEQSDINLTNFLSNPNYMTNYIEKIIPYINTYNFNTFYIGNNILDNPQNEESLAMKILYKNFSIDQTGIYDATNRYALKYFFDLTQSIFTYRWYLFSNENYNPPTYKFIRGFNTLNTNLQTLGVVLDVPEQNMLFPVVNQICKIK